MKKYTVVIVHIAKVSIFFWIALIIGLIFYKPLEFFMSIYVFLFLIYLIVSVIFFSYHKDKKVTDNILKMWKLYFPTIMLMSVFFFTMEANIRNFVIDKYKTQINYHIAIKSKDLNKTIEKYESLVNQHINSYKPQKIKSLYNDTEKKLPTVKKDTYIWYQNISLAIMNIMTLFMFLWALVEFIPVISKKNVLKD